MGWNGILEIEWTLPVLHRGGKSHSAYETAIRLNPLDPSLGLVGLGSVYIRIERYEEAIPVLKKTLHYQPDFSYAHVNLAACYAALGREEEAHAETAEVLRLSPKFSVKRYGKRVAIGDKVVKKRYIDALRKAGLPD